MSLWALFDLAEEHGTERFFPVSTDEAVDLVSILDAQKRRGETLVAASRSDGPMIATAERSGNALGSPGSVVPILDQQIDAGCALAVAHPEAAKHGVGE